jgi:hypothetical protein
MRTLMLTRLTRSPVRHVLLQMISKRMGNTKTKKNSRKIWKNNKCIILRQNFVMLSHDSETQSICWSVWKTNRHMVFTSTEYTSHHSCYCPVITDQLVYPMGFPIGLCICNVHVFHKSDTMTIWCPILETQSSYHRITHTSNIYYQGEYLGKWALWYTWCNISWFKPFNILETFK